MAIRPPVSPAAAAPPIISGTLARCAAPATASPAERVPAAAACFAAVALSTGFFLLFVWPIAFLLTRRRASTGLLAGVLRLLLCLGPRPGHHALRLALSE